MIEGAAFNEQHRLAFPYIDTPTLTVGLSDQALQIIITDQGAAYLPLPTVAEKIACGVLHRVVDAPEMVVPLYLMYAQDHANPETLHLALQGLRDLALAMGKVGPPDAC